MSRAEVRFRIMWRFATQATTPSPGRQPYVVLDLEAPDVEDGEIVVFGSFDSREAALMACMALNGSSAGRDSERRKVANEHS